MARLPAPLLLALVATACTNTQGWSRREVEHRTARCVEFYRARPDVQAKVEDLRKRGLDPGDLSPAALREQLPAGGRDDEMIEHGCDCAFRRLALTVRHSAFVEGGEERGPAFDQVRRTCLGEDQAARKQAEAAPKVPDPRLSCPEGTTPGSGVDEDEHAQLWCEDAAGAFHGPFRSFHGNGKLERETAYDHGLEQGVRRDFDEQGSLRSEEPYRAGELDGRISHWHPNRQLAYQGDHRGDECVGLRRWWKEDGSDSLTENCDVPTNEPQVREEFLPAAGGPERFTLTTLSGAYGVDRQGRARAILFERDEPIDLALGQVMVTHAWRNGSREIRRDPLLLLALKTSDGVAAGVVVRLSHVTVGSVRWSTPIPFEPESAVAMGRFLYVGGRSAAAKIDLLDGRLRWARRDLGATSWTAHEYDQGRMELKSSFDPSVPHLRVDDETGRTVVAPKGVR